ncbi:nucleotidyltransferase family protein [Actinoalloteichus hymeniacidonis]|uniref:Uncharacterized protein n=1 Tax=Actinoalloteichus hymeniacidonis TaxID=340345 RepID=A0AAC9MYL6_9PSEU|nr:nucleotidyltransferase family protein [Actinoalloteichus hymeniacidonis]AOS63031.1 hypothetical protein TL08_11085 [Actinoalloteichus hymeniacidonis]MBB5908934.1 hypothetical protein [Actinoalloteichus hymeniacidonis]
MSTDSRLMMDASQVDRLVRTLTRVATTLQAHRIPFAVTGGLAVYARGGPETDHDVDLLLRLGDVDKAVEVLVEAGLRAVDPPEDWLSKVYDGEVLVDLIHRPNERPVTDETLNRAEPMRVGAVLAPVVTATDVVIDKLLVFGPHRCDFTEALPPARALREQVDWAKVEAATETSPYAAAFLLLIDRLAVAETGVKRRS